METNNSIEQNFEQLENILKDMQAEDITLSRSFELYNEGLNLIKNCNQQIDDVEKQIKILEEGNDNESI